MDYKEQIKSPQWQKRRLEIFQKDDFTCQLCGNKDAPLNVHHLAYHKGRKIWEYEDWELITLCEKCHMSEHSYIDLIMEAIEAIKSRGATMMEIYSILSHIDICLYMGNNDCILDIIGEDSEMGLRDSDIRLLSERRKMLKSK